MEKISAVIVNKNGEKTIGKVIDSLKNLADELILMDDYSTDKTVEIVKKKFTGAKIIKRHSNLDLSEQRNIGLEKAKHKWVLMVDNDEEITPQLAEEIQTILKNPKHTRYMSRRDDYFFGYWVKSDSGRPILFTKENRFGGGIHNDLPGPRAMMNGSLVHHHYYDVRGWVDKLNNFSSFDVNKWYKEGRNYTRLHLLAMAFGMPPFMFCKWYFYEGYWKRGLTGLMYSLGSCTIWIFKAFKYWELKYGPR